MLALPTTPLGDLVLPMPPKGLGQPRFGRPTAGAFLRSTMPALDLAFGLEDPSAFPETIARLVARLDAVPPARSTVMEAEAVG